MNTVNKNHGIALITVLSLLVFVAVLLYGLAGLTSVVQSDIAKKNDIILARTYANAAIFDAESGAVARIRTFESSQFPIPTNMTNESRISVRNRYFTNNCINNQGMAGFTKGLCSAESADNGYSMPLLRLGTDVVRACTSGSIGTVISGQNALPLIDDRTSRFSFTYETGDATICHQPNYIIELINTNFNIVVNGISVSGARLYRVTAKAFGRNGNTQAIAQAYFYAGRNNNTGVVAVSLLNSQLLK
ncbi:pilus assembly protein [Aquella oligotrophica]|uniref:PilX/PilW C-terminal domain-containing protein n=1 Tax=Aquella oligotrophica TaxID=2067065 RepID=A0A2I7N974_9NEIS|nr:hypothetical protein [Aquella oligotrophica]AUR53014.1 hypothetical protein CUN60_12165 [Aquella oligotrophica]